MKCVQRPRVFSLNNNAISGQAIWLKRIIGADISRIQLELVSVPFAISPARTLVQLRVRKKPSHPRPLISLLSVILQEIDPSQRVAKIRPSNFRLALLENRLDRRNWEKVSSNASTISIPHSACFHFTFTAAKIRPCSNRHRVNHFLIFAFLSIVFSRRAFSTACFAVVYAIYRLLFIDDTNSAQPAVEIMEWKSGTLDRGMQIAFSRHGSPRNSAENLLRIESNGVFSSPRISEFSPRGF